ncbi:helix-turn-helix domain-containing protein [Xylophilus rhododendri]|uniref:Helix-turn-helix domain-containing protein n=1 Tax=Xylophilus rhododendri TaxID=2697032 RepID=A0A857J6B4_9BURK|nr:helix-turn-helix domain-containing protein [Xylophilus rhododendri]QHI98551.1 helix-turn-helix domain-containing protein [Xylophilus rhododendri]
MATQKTPEVDRSVAAVERTLSILDAFLQKDGPLKLKDLEDRTGLFRSVILRYMLTLESMHYVHRRADGRYQLGSRLYQLGQSYEKGFELSSYVLPVLTRIVELTSESASFYVREGETRLCLYRQDSPHALRVSVNAGRVVPLNETSTDQVLRDFAEGQGYPAEDPGSIVRQSAGILDEWSASISAPVLGQDAQLVGALTISGPKLRFDVQDPAVRKLLLQQALGLASLLGCPRVPRLD